MSFLGGFLTPPPSKLTSNVDAIVNGVQQKTNIGDKPPASIYNAFSGVKSIVSSYSSSKLQEGSVLALAEAPRHAPTEKELSVALQRFRLQSSDNHLGMLVAYNEKSLSPHLSEDFCFTWHRLRSGQLEDIHSYNTISMNAQSWYPPCADDLGTVVVLHCEDTHDLGLSRQLESTPIRADGSFVKRVESVIEQNKILERVVISSCNLHHGPPFRQNTLVPPPSSGKDKARTVNGRRDEHVEEENRSSESSSSSKHSNSNSNSSDSSTEEGPHVMIPEFEVGGSIAINSEGVLLRERGTHDCGLHIDCSNFLTLTCVHPASFIIALPLYCACSEDGTGDTSSTTSAVDPLAPISSIRDLSAISTMRPSVEWLGSPEGEMYASLEDVVNPDENPLEKSLEELGGGLLEQDYELLFSSLRLQVSCRDRATRDVLVLAIRSLAGCVLPTTVADEDTVANKSDAEQKAEEHRRGLPQRLARLPWHSHPQLIASSSPTDPSPGLPSSAQVTSLVVQAEADPRDERIAELEKTVEKLRAENVQLQRQLGPHDEAHMAEALESGGAQAAAMAALGQDCAALASELNTSSKKVEALQSEVRRLLDEKEVLVSTNTGQCFKIDELAVLVRELETARREAATCLEAEQAENSSLRRSLQEHERGQEVTRTGDGAEATGAMEELEGRCVEYISELKQAEDVIAKLRQQLLSQSHDNDTAASSISSNTEVSADKVSELACGADVVTELKNLIEKFNICMTPPDESEESQGEGVGSGILLVMPFVEAIRSHLLSQCTQHEENRTKLIALESLMASSEAEHKGAIKMFQDREQKMYSGMTEKNDAHRISSEYDQKIIDGLNESVSDLQQHISKLEELSSAAERNVSVLQAKCVTLEEEQSSHEDARVVALTEEIDKVTDECNKWHEECQRLKEMMISMQKSGKSKDELAATLKNDFDILSVRLQEVKQQNEMITLQAEKDARCAKEKEDRACYDLTQAAHTVQVLEARIAGLQSEMMTLSDERQILQRQKSAFDSSKNQISQLRGQLMESDQTAQATRALLDETSASNSRLTKEYREMSIELATVNNLLLQKTARIDELKDRLQVMDNEISSSDKVKSSFRKENARLKEAAKKLKEDSEAVKTLRPLYNQQLSKIAVSHSRIVDLESALSDITKVRNQYSLTVSSLELTVGVLEKALQRRTKHSEREGMTGEDQLGTNVKLLAKTQAHEAQISQLEADLAEAKMAEPFELKKLNFMVCKLNGEKNHYENKAKSLSKDLQRKLLAGTPLQRELGKLTARLEEVENERNAYRDAMVLACETYSTKEVSSWFS